MSDATASRVLQQSSRDALLGFLLLAARLPIVLAALGVLSRVAEPPADPTTRARARAIADRYGCGALLPFQLGEVHHALCPAAAVFCWPASGCSAADSKLLAWSAACDNLPTALTVASCLSSSLGCSPSIGRIWF